MQYLDYLSPNLKIIASVATSADHYMDDITPQRLIISSAADYRQVLKLRAACDAIMVGAETIRKDNPQLTVRQADLQAERTAQGKLEDPIKVTLTTSGNINVESAFFRSGTNSKLVFCSNAVPHKSKQELQTAAEVISGTEPSLTASFIINQLEQRNIKTLLIEGGPKTLTLFLSAGKISTLRYAIGPQRLEELGGPKFFPPSALETHFRAQLNAAEQFEDTQVLWYRFSG